MLSVPLWDNVDSGKTWTFSCLFRKIYGDNVNGNLNIDVSKQNHYNKAEQTEGRAVRGYPWLSAKYKTERGDTMVELDQFKAALNAFKEPFVEVRDSL